MNFVCQLSLLVLFEASPDTWMTALKDVAATPTADLASAIERHLDVVVIDLSKPDSLKDKEAFSFYSAYWKSQRFKLYPGIYLNSKSLLPKTFADRPLKDRPLIIVSAETDRDVYFHLLLHHIDQASDRHEQIKQLDQALRRRSEIKSPDELQALNAEIFKLKVDILLSDQEAEKDLFLLENASTFKFETQHIRQLTHRLALSMQRHHQSLEALEIQGFDDATRLAEVKTKIKDLEARQTIIIEKFKDQLPPVDQKR